MLPRNASFGDFCFGMLHDPRAPSQGAAERSEAGGCWILQFYVLSEKYQICPNPQPRSSAAP